MCLWVAEVTFEKKRNVVCLLPFSLRVQIGGVPIQTFFLKGSFMMHYGQTCEPQDYTSIGGVRTTITSSLEDYLRGIPGEGLEEELAREVEEEKLAVIALHIDEWRQLCPFLGLKKVDECTILGNHPHSVKVQR